MKIVANNPNDGSIPEVIMSKILDFLKAHYQRKSNNADPVVRTFMNICSSIHDDPELMHIRELFRERLSLPEKEFDELYASYKIALLSSKNAANWNNDIEGQL